MTATDRIADAASLIAAARLARQPMDALPVLVRPRDEAEAYWVQSAVHRMIARSRFGARVGYRVGAASPAAQNFHGVHRPVSGGLFAGTIHQNGVELIAENYVRLGMEGAIAVRLGEDLPSSEGPFDGPRVADAVAAYMPAVQIVDDRFVDWRKIDTATLIADDFFGAAAVIGPEVAADELGDAASLRCTAMVNGHATGTGNSSDLLGHPMNALAWLANAMIGRGEQLHAGDTVMLGGLVPTRWLRGNEAVRFEIDRLGTVEFSVVP